MSDPRTILGIETSCDETSAAVVRGTLSAPELASLVILSQDVHRVFGGVVPEIASRQHLSSIVPVVNAALEDAHVTLDQCDAIAVTHAPGLVGALLVGTTYAKALGWRADRVVVPVHHMEGHLFATVLEDPDAHPPFIALLVSGGHTMLLDVPAWGAYTLLGQTRDDAVGEAFDKVAKLLGLPYPGGRPLEALAATVAAERAALLRFPRPMLRARAEPTDDDYYDLSFSGLKTAVLLEVQRGAHTAAEIARAFQDAVLDTLVAKVDRAVRQFRRTRVVLGGGVAGNRALRDALAAQVARRHATLSAPSPRLATDNAAMIAAAGLYRFAVGDRADAAMTAHASLPLPGVTLLRSPVSRSLSRSVRA